MTGTEERDGTEVVEAFVGWLRTEGWEVDTEVDWADLRAVRGDEVLIAGTTGAPGDPGRDVDAAYGELLRRIDPDSGVRYALVLPEAALGAALRVPEKLRAQLGITLFGVADDGTVHEVDRPT